MSRKDYPLAPRHILSGVVPIFNEDVRMTQEGTRQSYERRVAGIDSWLMNNKKIPEPTKNKAITHITKSLDTLRQIYNIQREYDEGTKIRCGDNWITEYLTGIETVKGELAALKELLKSYLPPTPQEVNEWQLNLSRFYMNNGVDTKIAGEWSRLPTNAIRYLPFREEGDFDYLKEGFRTLTEVRNIEPNAAAILLAHPDIWGTYIRITPPVASKRNIETIINEYQRIVEFENPDTVLAAARIVIPHLGRKNRG